MSPRSSRSCPAVRETERTVVGRARRAQAAADPHLADPARRSARPARCGCWRPARTRPRPWRWRCPAPGEIQAPAAGAHGRRRTLWLLDRAAAAQAAAAALPAGVGLNVPLSDGPAPDRGRGPFGVSAAGPGRRGPRGQRPRSSGTWRPGRRCDGVQARHLGALGRAGSTRLASTLPSSTPHWSKESMFHTAPCTNTLCS